MDLLVQYKWGIFITLEVLSLVSLLVFCGVRYFLDKRKLSNLFIFLFLFFLFLEALLALLIFQWTGEVSTIQIVIAVFLLYACTFGIADFKKLDRWMREKIGKIRGIRLLTDDDYRIITRNRDPKYLAKKYRWSSTIHLIVFIIVQYIFWSMGTTDIHEMISYLKDLSWFETGHYEDSPYPNEAIYAVGMIWTVIFVVDFIWSWSYTILPAKRQDD